MGGTGQAGRMLRAGLLGVLVAAGIGRAALGADTEASVIFHPAFQIAVLPAALVGWLGAARFGSRRGVDLALAALTVLTALAAGLVTNSLAGADARGLVVMLGRQPMAWGGVAGAFVLTQALAWRQAAPWRAR